MLSTSETKARGADSFSKQKGCSCSNENRTELQARHANTNHRRWGSVNGLTHHEGYSGISGGLLGPRRAPVLSRSDNFQIQRLSIIGLTTMRSALHQHHLRHHHILIPHTAGSSGNALRSGRSFPSLWPPLAPRQASCPHSPSVPDRSLPLVTATVSRATDHRQPPPTLRSWEGTSAFRLLQRKQLKSKGFRARREREQKRQVKKEADSFSVDVSGVCCSLDPAEENYDRNRRYSNAHKTVHGYSTRC